MALVLQIPRLIACEGRQCQEGLFELSPFPAHCTLFGGGRGGGGGGAAIMLRLPPHASQAPLHNWIRSIGGTRWRAEWWKKRRFSPAHNDDDDDDETASFPDLSVCRGGSPDTPTTLCPIGRSASYLVFFPGQSTAAVVSASWCKLGHRLQFATTSVHLGRPWRSANSSLSHRRLRRSWHHLGVCEAAAVCDVTFVQSFNTPSNC
uniref:Uncharacterized protein n=1 Tax=Mesocestoides corti TaxID=53468 RepID=A0A5K3FP55_MESCO